MGTKFFQTLTILLIFFSINCFSQQNIQTFFPSSLPPPPLLPPPPPPVDDPISVPLPPPQPPQSPSSPSTRAAVGRAIGITAASTLVLSGLLFFLLLQRSRRKRAREQEQTAAAAPPVAPNAVFRPQDDNFIRVDGNIKGVIVDENGLDVLYWRKLEEGSNGESFNKQEYKRLKDDDGEKRTVSGKGKRFEYDPPVQELPLLRGKSSTSQSVIWVDHKQDNSDRFKKPNSGSFKAVERQTSIVQIAKLSTPAPPPVAPPPPRLPPPMAMEAVPKEKPPPKGPAPPPPPPPNGAKGASAAIPRPPMPNKRSTSEGESSKGDGQVKLKPLHWDKVNPNVEHSMVWDKLDKGSFKFDGDLMEALFGTVATSRKSPRGDTPTGDKSGPPPQIFILETKKSQNTAIILKSLGISHKEIIDALVEGRGLDADILEKLTRIAPNNEEVALILAFDGDPTRLADAESFLYHLLKTVPSAFIRFNAMSFRSNYDSEVTHVKESLRSLESACNELRTRGLFLKLLEAILKAGNRLNAGTSRGNAQAFNLTALRKLSDVKSSDGKTTLLQFVVQEVVRAEGKRCVLNRSQSVSRTSSRNAGNGNQTSDNSMSKDQREKEYMMLGLPVIGGLSGEFSNVKKAAVLDYDLLVKTIESLAVQVAETQRVVGREDGGFAREMNGFLDTAKLEIGVVKEEQIRVMELVRKTKDYYQAGSSKDKGANANQFQLFVIVRDFLGMVDKVCIDIARDVQNRKPVNTAARVAGPSSSSPPESPRVFRFPKLPANFMSDSSKSNSSDSDDEESSKR